MATPQPCPLQGITPSSLQQTLAHSILEYNLAMRKGPEGARSRSCQHHQRSSVTLDRVARYSNALMIEGS